MRTFLKIFFGSLLGCLVALLLALFIGIGSLGSLLPFSGSSSYSSLSSAVLRLDFSAPVVEHNTSSSLDIRSLSFSDEAISILDMVQAIRFAETDPVVKYIYLDVDQASISMSHAEALRNALLHFRQSGKAIIAYGTSFDNITYYLASVADKVIVHGFGDSYITGLSTTMFFFKDILDKLGVKMQLIRHGKYKSAAEQYIKSNISPENYEQNKVMLDNIWNVWCEEICASRDFTKEEFNAWVDNLELIDASSLIQHGLADHAFYKEELENYLCTLFDVEGFDDVDFIDIDRYAKVRLTQNYKYDQVAVLYAEGEIVSAVPNSLNQTTAIVAEDIISDIRELREDDKVKVVVLRVNSPGGSALEAEKIRHELQLLREKKPLIVSFGDVAASGGYWISAEADKIFTEKTTLTGSIGVFSLVPSIEEGLKKIHLNSTTINTHTHSDVTSITQNLDSEEEAFFQKSVEKVYTEFISLVASGRNMSVAQVDEIGQGRVWSGTDAVKNGLADEIGGLRDAIEYAAAMVDLENYWIYELPYIKSPYEKLMDMMQGVNVKVALPNGVDAVMDCYTYLINYDKPTVMARLPLVYDIR